MSLASRTLGGMRASDLVRWDWSMIDRAHFAEAFIPRSKTGTPDLLEVPEMVRPFLRARWEQHGCPEAGPVFPCERGRRAGQARQIRGTCFADRLRHNLFVAGVVRAEPVQVAYTKPGTRTDLGKKSPQATRLAPNPRDPLYHETATTLPVDFHSFRRAFSTALAEAGVNVQHAMLLAHHSDPKVHMRYVRQTQAMRRIPVAALPALPAGTIGPNGAESNERSQIQGVSLAESPPLPKAQTATNQGQSVAPGAIRKPQVWGSSPQGGSRDFEVLRALRCALANVVSRRFPTPADPELVLEPVQRVEQVHRVRRAPRDEDHAGRGQLAPARLDQDRTQRGGDRDLALVSALRRQDLEVRVGTPHLDPTPGEVHVAHLKRADLADAKAGDRPARATAVRRPPVACATIEATSASLGASTTVLDARTYVCECAGILVEASLAWARPTHEVPGIGLRVLERFFSVDLAPSATSVAMHADPAPSRLEVLAAPLGQVGAACMGLCRSEAAPDSGRRVVGPQRDHGRPRAPAATSTFRGVLARLLPCEHRDVEHGRGNEPSEGACRSTDGLAESTHVAPAPVAGAGGLGAEERPQAHRPGHDRQGHEAGANMAVRPMHDGRREDGGAQSREGGRNIARREREHQASCERGALDHQRRSAIPAARPRRGAVGKSFEGRQRATGDERVDGGMWRGCRSVGARATPLGARCVERGRGLSRRGHTQTPRVVVRNLDGVWARIALRGGRFRSIGRSRDSQQRERGQERPGPWTTHVREQGQPACRRVAARKKSEPTGVASDAARRHRGDECGKLPCQAGMVVPAAPMD
jgi:hypothetical protein